MKTIIIILVFLGVSMNVFSQENKKIKEVGLTFYNVDNFGLSFKAGHQNALWRYSLLFIRGGANSRDRISDSIRNENSQIGYGLRFGREFRKPITDNFELRYGIDLTYHFQYSTYESVNSKNEYPYNQKRYVYYHTPGLNLIFGFNYVYKNSFVIGAEVLPFFEYAYSSSKYDSMYDDETIETEIVTSGFRYGLNSNAVMVSLAYRF